jgi:hypothetical protein
MLATVAGTVVVAAAAIRVGHAGGQLVYVHNAGAAYVTAAPGTGAPGDAPTTRLEQRHRDEGR